MFVLPISFVLIKVLNQEGIVHLYGRKKKEEVTEENDNNKDVSSEEPEKEEPVQANAEN